jgi:Sulfatase-modifying factor enzyme 1
VVHSSTATSPTPLQREVTSKTLDEATKDRPWVNSLGMKFVPVPSTKVLFSVWDTRVQDFEKFVKDTGYDAMGGMLSLGNLGWQNFGATWKDPGFAQGPTYPAVGVSWMDAEAFCKWLTTLERNSGVAGSNSLPAADRRGMERGGGPAE